MSSDRTNETEHTKESFSLGYKKINIPSREDLEKIKIPQFDPSIFANLLSGLSGGESNTQGNTLNFENFLSSLKPGIIGSETTQESNSQDPPSDIDSILKDFLTSLKNGPIKSEPTPNFDPSTLTNLLSGLGGSMFDPSTLTNLLSDPVNKSNKATIDYNPFKINNIQNYNPIYKEIFELTPKNYNIISLNHNKHVVFDKEKANENSVPIEKSFIKYSPLLDPYRYLTGKYTNTDNLTVLPSIDESVNSHPKLNDPNNASYIDNFFCYLSSQLKNKHSLPNAIDYYGSYLAVQEKFRVNIADDIDYLRNSDYFSNNKNIIYEIECSEEEDPFANFGSRKNKEKISLHNGSNISHLSIEDLDIKIDNGGSIIEDIEQVYENDKSNDDDNDDDDDDGSSNNSEMNYTSSDESEGDDSDDDDGDDDSDHSNDDEEDDEEEDFRPATRGASDAALLRACK